MIVSLHEKDISCGEEHDDRGEINVLIDGNDKHSE